MLIKLYDLNIIKISNHYAKKTLKIRHIPIMNVSFKFRSSNQTLISGVIYARVCVDGLTADVSTFVKTYRDLWVNSEIIGENSKALNAKIKKVETNLHFIYDVLLEEQIPVSARLIVNIYNAVKKSPKTMALSEIVRKEYAKTQSPIIPILENIKAKNKTFIDIYIEFLHQECDLKNWTDNTIRNNNNMLNNIVEFLKANKIENIKPNELKPKHLDMMRLFYSSRLGTTTLSKIIGKIIKATKYAITHEYISDSPILFYEKPTGDNIDKTCLTSDELTELRLHDFDNPNLNIAKDIFVFMCYTGQSISDYNRFANDPFSFLKNDNGQMWIFQNRKKIQEKHKNKTMAIIPLFDIAAEIFLKYETKLPIMCDVSLNRFLKKIASKLHIDKKLSTKVARKTFGNNLWNSQVDGRAVQKMMGHTDIRTTMKYYVDTEFHFVKSEFEKIASNSTNIKRLESDKITKI